MWENVDVSQGPLAVDGHSNKPDPRRRRSALLRTAQFGQAAWFFGNVYEALVGMPQLLAGATQYRQPGLLTAGSPVRYYLPFAPVAVAGTTAALLDSWRSGGDRRMIAATAMSGAGALALSGYLIRTVNQPLLIATGALSVTEQRGLISTWHRINALRLLALATAIGSLSRLDRGREAGRSIPRPNRQNDHSFAESRPR
jgi:hypothetical protein